MNAAWVARRAWPFTAAVALLAACAVPAGSATAPATAPSAPAPAPARVTAAGPPEPAAPPETTVVAQAVDGTAAVYAGPIGGRPVRHLTSPAPGAPLVFQVLAADQDRVKVSLAVRPAGSTGWVDQTTVRLSRVDWRLVVFPAAHELQVRQAGRLVETDPVGVGKGVSPTPAGTYYITELLAPPDPTGSYGPYAFGLSAHSPTLTEFAGGDGQIGLHGTNDPAGIGHDVSHGCIRVTNVVITRLAHELPLGTPVEIRAGWPG